MRSIALEGRTYAFHDVGVGVPLLLLHGFPFTSESYWPQLESPPKGFRLIVPDHRGFGQSAAATGTTTMEAMADDALRLLDALSLGPAVVGGVSMGGYVAMALARLDPGRVRGLVLIDTQATADDEAGRARRETVAADVLANGVAGLVQGMLPKLFAAGTEPAIRNRVEAMMLAQQPDVVAKASRGMGQRSDSKDLLARFFGPALIVVGAEDVITPPEKARAMGELISGATVEVVAQAGHLTPVEQPARFNALLEAFAPRFG